MTLGYGMKPEDPDLGIDIQVDIVNSDFPFIKVLVRTFVSCECQEDFKLENFLVAILSTSCPCKSNHQ